MICRGNQCECRQRDHSGRFVKSVCMVRAEAKAQDLKRYLGQPCPHGHSAERYTSSADCCECKRLDFLARSASSRERYNGYARRYYHAQSPEKLAESRKKFAEERKAWEKKNPEKVAESKKSYRLANMDRWRSYVRNRRARLKGVTGSHDHNDILVLRSNQSDRCAHCQIDLFGGGEVDHKTALSRGGSNWPHNLQLLCMPCNRKKHAKDPVVHARAIGLLPSTAAVAAEIANQPGEI